MSEIHKVVNSSSGQLIYLCNGQRMVYSSDQNETPNVHGVNTCEDGNSFSFDSNEVTCSDCLNIMSQ